MKKILFVCTGNTCRSPMAEAVFNKLAGESGVDARAGSAGVGVWASTGPAARAIAAMNAYEVNITNHKSRQASHPDLRDADAVYCMTASVCEALTALFPQYQDRYHLLSQAGIPDPYGGTQADYDLAAARIVEAVGLLLSDMKRKQEND